MATNLNDNLQIKSTKPNFTREQFSTKQDMLSYDKRGLSNGLIAYCIEDKTHYKFEREANQPNTEGGWTELINSSYDNTDLDNKLNTSLKYSSLANSFIKMKYRDHYDIENGSMNFVSPLYKFFGWYVPEAMHGSTKVDDTAGSKKFYVPSVYRWIGDSSLSIETISEADTKIGVEGSRRVEPYTTEFNAVDMDLFNSGFSWKHELSGEDRSVSAKSVGAFSNMKVLSTGIFHKNVEGMNLNNNQEVDIVGMYINWAGIPEGGYIRISVSKHRTAANTFRLLVKNTNSSSAKVGNLLYKGFENDIKTLDLYNSDKNYYYYEGMGESIKIERPTEKGTLILLESRGNGANNDSMQGLNFNVYFPEAYYLESTRGINESEFTYIKDLSTIGKANNALTQFTEYNYLPSYPKNGDIIKVIDNIDIKGKTTYREFMCIYGYAYEDYQFNANFINPSNDKHPDTLRYSAPIGKDVNPTFFKYYLGIEEKLDVYFTKFKEIHTNASSTSTENNNTITKNNIVIVTSEEFNSITTEEGVLYVVKEV